MRGLAISFFTSRRALLNALFFLLEDIRPLSCHAPRGENGQFRPCGQTLKIIWTTAVLIRRDPHNNRRVCGVDSVSEGQEFEPPRGCHLSHSVYLRAFLCGALPQLVPTALHRLL